MDLVSVIVLSYKSEDTIVQTLDSIKNQTYPDIDLIIADDCSPDNTAAVAMQWLGNNEHCMAAAKLVTAECNTGIPGNINRALKRVNGRYVKLIAADDYLAADAISEYVRFCERNPGVLPIAKVHLFSDEAVDFTSVETYCDRCYEFAVKPYKDQYHMLLKQNCIVAPSGSFYLTEAIKKAGGYDERYRWFEDYPMNLKMMHGGYRFGLIDRELVYYRISGGSVTASQQLRLKQAEAELFFRKRFWYMFQAGMGREALGQMKYWGKIAMRKKA